MQRIFHVLGLFVAVTVILLGSGASRADEIMDRRYFRDATSLLEYDQVRHRDFQPYSGVLSAGYGKDTVWLRLTVRPADTTSLRSLLVRIRPPILDQVVIYDTGGKAQITGDFHPGSKDGIRSTHLNAEIEVPPQGGDVFISIRSETARSIIAEVLTMEDAARKDALHLAAIAAYCVVVLMSGLLAVMHWYRFSEKVFGWFVIRQFFEFVYIVMNLGIVRYIFQDTYGHVLSNMTNVTNILYVGVSLTFVYVLISEYRPTRITHYAFGLILTLWIGALVLLGAGFVMEALRLNILTGLATTVILVPASFATAPQRTGAGPVMPKSAMVGMCSVISLSGGIAIFVQLGVLQNALRNPELTLYAAHIHGLVTTTCMTAFMYARAIRLAAKHEQSERMLIMARVQSEQDRKNRESQEKLLSMLAHELRTPMAVMKMQLGPWLSDVEGVQELRLAVDEMAAVLDKTIHAGQVADGALSLSISTFDLKAELDRAGRKLEGRPLQVESHGIGDITSDRTLIRIVLNNLVENALKYGSHEAPVIIRARHDVDDASLRLSVINERSEYGLPDPETVFQKYSRGPQAHRQSGSGLGLFIVDTIAKRLGGAAFYERHGDLVEFGIVVSAAADRSSRLDVGTEAV